MIVTSAFITSGTTLQLACWLSSLFVFVISDPVWQVDAWVEQTGMEINQEQLNYISSGAKQWLITIMNTHKWL